MNRTSAFATFGFSLTLGFIFFSCAKDVGTAPKAPVTVPGFCDTINYAEDIKPIIDAKCVSCHGDVSPSGGFPLTSYEQLKEKAEAGRIKARVIDQKPSPMPPAPAGPLPQNELDLISCWLNNGYK